jgi:hypothetical protein
VDVFHRTIYETCVCETWHDRKVAWHKDISIEEALSFYTKYIQDAKSTRRGVCDDKEEPTMNHEVLEGNGRPCKLSTNLKN